MPFNEKAPISGIANPPAGYSPGDSPSSTGVVPIRVPRGGIGDSDSESDPDSRVAPSARGSGSLAAAACNAQSRSRRATVAPGSDSQWALSPAACQ